MMRLLLSIPVYATLKTKFMRSFLFPNILLTTALKTNMIQVSTQTERAVTPYKYKGW